MATTDAIIGQVVVDLARAVRQATDTLVRHGVADEPRLAPLISRLGLVLQQSADGLAAITVAPEGPPTDDAYEEVIRGAVARVGVRFDDPATAPDPTPRELIEAARDATPIEQATLSQRALEAARRLGHDPAYRRLAADLEADSWLLLGASFLRRGLPRHAAQALAAATAAAGRGSGDPLVRQRLHTLEAQFCLAEATATGDPAPRNPATSNPATSDLAAGDLAAGDPASPAPDRGS